MRFLIIITIFLLTGLAITGCIQAVPNQPDDESRLNLPPAAVSDTLQQLIRTEIKNATIPGIQIEIATPEWTWNSAEGNASPITGEQAEPGMRFLIASITKTFTSIAVQKLAEEGKLSLDDPIERWLAPDLIEKIPNGRLITIRQLLDHTSGIADYDETSINMEELSNPDTPIPYQISIAQGLRASPLFEPGTNYTYSNVNYNLLTLIIDNASGIPYEDYVTRTILIPAEMNETFIQHTNHIPGLHMRATMPSENGTFNDFTDLYVLFDRGAGDIISTTADLNKFHRALREGNLISKASLKEMEKPTSQSGKAGYGLGYSTEYLTPPGITVQGHTGGYPGSFSFWYYLPEQDTYVTYNLNSLGTSIDGIKNIRTAILAYVKSVIPVVE